MDFRRSFYVFGYTATNIILPLFFFLFNLLLGLLDMVEKAVVRMIQNPNDKKLVNAPKTPEGRHQNEAVQEPEPTFDRRSSSTSSDASAQPKHQHEIDATEDNNIAIRIVQMIEAREVDTIQQAKLVIRLISLQFSKEESVEAAKNCSSVNAAITYMNQKCEACQKNYPMGQMIPMFNCTHSCCESCAKSFFSMQITYHSVTDCICPYCREPDLTSNKMSIYDKKEYFANLSVVFERLLTVNVFKIYDNKLKAFLNIKETTENANSKVQNSCIKSKENSIANESLQQSAPAEPKKQQKAPNEFDSMQHLLHEFLQEGKVKNFAQGEIAVTLLSLKFTEEQALDASKNCNTLDNALSYLNQECNICKKKFSMSQMSSMLNCDHHFCRPCAKNYFTEIITNNSITQCTCPTCELPNLDTEDDSSTYLANLDIMLKGLLDAEVHEQFQEILRNYSLRNDPSETTQLSKELKTQAQQYLTDGRVKNYMQSELMVRLIQAGYTEEDSLEASKHCCTLDGAVAFLEQECNICTDKFQMNEMMTMLNCEHRFCNDCAKQYFTVQISERPILDCTCPECSLPDLNDDNMSETEKNQFFSNMDIMMKTVLEPTIHDVFQKKLRDWSLSKNPNFKWCPQCSSGYITEITTGQITCPDCRAITCVNCQKPWEDQHAGISCDRFTEWKEANNPETQETAVANHMALNGIDCPKCKYRFSLVKGGCMHFTCSQCKYEFCQGCAKPFNNRCTIIGCTLGRGLHAHHPRNCLYYLRDKNPVELQGLLRKYNVPYDTDRPANIPNMSTCSAVLQMSRGRDGYCSSAVSEGQAGLCGLHYIEYLAGLIKTHNIDSVDLLETSYITHELTRNGFEAPKHDPATTSPEAYKEICAKILKEKIPLELKSV